MTNVQCRMFNVRMFRHLGGTASPSVDATTRRDGRVAPAPPVRFSFLRAHRSAVA